jgi:uncharacterized protein (DUF1684 family)
MDLDEALQLAEWRRTVAEHYARWREDSRSDPEAATTRLRTARDELFGSHPQSPIPSDQRARFGGLSYYPYDPAYRMTAKVEPVDEPTNQGAGGLGTGVGAIQLPTSGQTPFSFRKVGYVTLSGPLAGHRLPLFWMEGYAGGLFLPFRDATCGTETYAAGRYLLDAIKGADHGGDPGSRELVLDFNLAYHPSCTYDPKWNCPLAPPESRLPVPVRVGERLA